MYNRLDDQIEYLQKKSTKKTECPVQNCKSKGKRFTNLKKHISNCAKLGDVAHQQEAIKRKIKY